MTKKAGNVEYKMPKLQASNVLKKYRDERKNPQDILIKYVNENCGLLRNCTRVIVE